MKAISRLAAAVFAAAATLAGAEPKEPMEFPAAAEKAPPVVAFSGISGQGKYVDLSKKLADAGFFVVLYDGTDFRRMPDAEFMALVRSAIERAQSSPRAAPGKVGVVGFSLGGVAALGYASRMPDIVSAVVAQYPVMSHITDPAQFVSRIRVPALLMAGGRDTLNNCCLLEDARKLDAAARAGGSQLVELVEYPPAKHAWNLQTNFDREIADDSMARTIKHLRTHLK